MPTLPGPQGERPLRNWNPILMAGCVVFFVGMVVATGVAFVLARELNAEAGRRATAEYRLEQLERSLKAPQPRF
jgi:hypothetical protein